MNRLLPLATAALLAACGSDPGPVAGNGSETTTGIAVRVLDSLGQPAAGALVRLRPDGWSPDTAHPDLDPFPSATAGPDGMARFASVPAGWWRAEAVLEGRSATGAPLSPGGNADLHLAAGAVLQGRVALAVGAPGAWVRIPGLSVLSRTDALGRFELTGLPAGDLRLEAIAGTAGRDARRVSLRSGDTLRALELSPRPAQSVPGSEWTDSVLIDLAPDPGASDTTLVDFPLLVALSDTAIDFRSTRGHDLRLERAGRVLAHEVESWDPVSRRAWIWVLLDSVATGRGLRLTLRWGHPDAPDRSDASAVFPASAGWRGVWHLDARAPSRDASTGAHHATDWRTLAAPGVSGAGRFCDTGWLAVDDHPDLRPASFSASTWVQRKGSQVVSARFLTRGARTDGRNGWSLQTLDDRATPGFTTVRTDSVYDTLVSAHRLADRTWTHLAGTWDAATGRARLLVDGVAVDSSLSTTPVAEFLGHDPRLFLGANFIGTLDEARLADRARPPAWFRLEHRTQVPGSTALRFHHPP